MEGSCFRLLQKSSATIYMCTFSYIFSLTLINVGLGVFVYTLTLIDVVGGLPATSSRHLSVLVYMCEKLVAIAFVYCS